MSREKLDSTKFPLKVSGEITLNSNGIAPMPAFALGKPTVMANITLKKKDSAIIHSCRIVLILNPGLSTTGSITN